MPQQETVELEGLPFGRRFRFRLEALGLRTAAGLVQRLPFFWVAKLARVAGWVAFHLDGRGRGVALENLRIVFGDEYSEAERRVIARKSYQYFARTMLELLWSPNLNNDGWRKVTHLHIAGGEPPAGAGIYYCLHFGNFEWLNHLGALAIERGMVIAQKFRNPLLTPIFAQLRGSTGNEVIPQERAVIRMLKFLKAGRKFGALTDLNIDPREGAVVIECFGLKTCVTPLVGTLIKRVPTAVVPCEAVPAEDGRWNIYFHEPLVFPAEANERDIAQACWDRLEPSIRKHPELWLWPYKHWRFKPRDAEREYPFYSNHAKRFDKLVG